MSLRICILASGSSGNCTYIGSDTTSILIDAGLSAKRTAERLAEIDRDMASIRGVCVSHEHNDHITGLRVLHGRYGVPIYANAGTIDALRRFPELAAISWQMFTTGSPFHIGDLRIEPFSVPHDAYDPVGFVVESQGARVGVVTDMGMATTLIRERLRRCHAVVIEANHDDQLLADAERPWALKQRIKGRQGHLSNEHAAAMIAEIAGPDLRQIFLAHLSEDCNRHELALKCTRKSLTEGGHHHVKVSLTFPDRISEIWSYAQPC